VTKAPRKNADQGRPTPFTPIPALAAASFLGFAPVAAVPATTFEWAEPSPSASPPPRVSPTGADDAATGRVVLFGGEVGVASDQTWICNGSEWAEAQPTHGPSIAARNARDRAAERR